MLSKKKKKKEEEEEEKEPKGDEYIVAYIWDKGLKISKHILMKALECKMRVLL